MQKIEKKFEKNTSSSIDEIISPVRLADNEESIWTKAEGLSKRGDDKVDVKQCKFSSKLKQWRSDPSKYSAVESTAESRACIARDAD